jgi:hypothetical protein
MASTAADAETIASETLFVIKDHCRKSNADAPTTDPAAQAETVTATFAHAVETLAELVKIASRAPAHVTAAHRVA